MNSEMRVLDVEEERKRILHARALELARPPPAKPATRGAMEVIEFVLAREHYAIETAFVREVYPLHHLTPLPCTPPFVTGIVNMRGQILAIIDLKKFFDLPEQGISDHNKLVVLRNAEMEFGVLADAIIGVRILEGGSLEPTLPTLTGRRADYLKGVTAERLVVLDAQKLMADPRIRVEEEPAG